MQTIMAMILLSSLPVAADDDVENRRYLALRESECFLFCSDGEGDREGINLEFGSRLAGENCCVFTEWRVSQTIRSARWRPLFSTEQTGFAYTSVGVTATARTPYVNLVARVGVFAVGVGEQVLRFDDVSKYYELDVGWGVMERFEWTAGFGPRRTQLAGALVLLTARHPQVEPFVQQCVEVIAIAWPGVIP